MHSAENEKVALKKEVRVSEVVEDWLSALTGEMQNSLKQLQK